MTEDSVIDTVSVQQFIDLMQEMGLPARRFGDGNKPYVASSVGPFPFHIMLIGASGENGYSVASLVCLLSDIVLPFEAVNRWNRTQFFIKAIVADNGSTALEMNMVLHGVTKAYLRRSFAIWHNAVGIFFDRLDELEDAA
jgi:hypothetical protein